jgi:hypothetical protein
MHDHRQSNATAHSACAFPDNLAMQHLELARLAWQTAQADVQVAVAELEKQVACRAGPEEIAKGRELVARRQEAADLLLQRYITQIGKS